MRKSTRRTQRSRRLSSRNCRRWCGNETFKRVLVCGSIFPSIDRMNAKQFGLALFVVLSILQIQPAKADDTDAVQPTKNTLVIHADQGENTISRNIYGQFSEHLGRCVYGGIWVGEDSPIPNTRGIRDDVVAALKKIEVPVLRWPGGCFADEYHWMN